MKQINTNIIVFISGAFFSNSIWDEWRIYFEANGFITIAPPWPHKDATTEELKRRHPDAAIAAMDLQQLVDHYSSILKQLPEKTILVGHSAGGLVTQLLLQEDLAQAGIAIHSFPPKGIGAYRFLLFKSLFALSNLFGSAKQSLLLSLMQWKYFIANGMPLAQQQSGYDQFLVPESKKIIRSGLYGTALIDFHKPHPPLLFISGSSDNLVPASLNFINYKKYAQNGSITDYRKFRDNNHFVLRQPAWQEAAAFILHWIKKIN